MSETPIIPEIVQSENSLINIYNTLRQTGIIYCTRPVYMSTVCNFENRVNDVCCLIRQLFFKPSSLNVESLQLFFSHLIVQSEIALSNSSRKTRELEQNLLQVLQRVQQTSTESVECVLCKGAAFNRLWASIRMQFGHLKNVNSYALV